MNGDRIAKNTFLLYIRMAIVMIVNLYTVRIVFNALGETDYGVYNVVAGVVTMLQSFSTVLSTSTQRFYSVSIGAKQIEKLKKIFSCSINIYILFSIVVLLLAETVGLWFINAKLQIPPERMVAANWIYQFSIFSFIATLLQAPYYSAVIAHEDMNIFAVISLGEVFLKLGAAIVMTYIVFDRLVFYGLYLLIVPTLALLAYALIGRKRYQECHYIRVREKGLYKQILSFSGWHLFSSLASVSMNQINTILVNIFFGPIANAARAIALQISSALTSFSGSFIMAIRPPMMKAYAEGNYHFLNKLFNLSNKIIYYLMLIIVLPLMFEMDIVLKLWLNTTDAQTILFSRLILVYGLILVLNNPISIIVQAIGKVKEYFLPVEVFTILCPVATYVLFKMGFPAEATFYTMIVAIVLSHIVRLICLKKMYSGFSIKEYLLHFVLPAFLITLVIVSVLLCCKFMFDIKTIPTIIISIIGTSLVAYFLGFTKEDKERIIGLVNVFKSKIKSRQ